MDIIRSQVARSLAHPGPPPAPGNLWSTWTADPVVLAGLVMFAWLYVRGVQTFRLRGRYSPKMTEAGSFAAGLLVLAFALLSPLDGLSAALFSAHMVQHLLLILVAAPLLVLGNLRLPLLWALPLAWRRRVGHLTRWPGFNRPWRMLTSPPLAWTLSAAMLWAWHLPVLYQAALRSPALHALEHICLLATALLFWYVIVERGGNRRCGYGAAIAYVLAMSLHGSVLGIVIAFSRPWYMAYVATTAAWNLTPAEDQQIAGLIMWIPAGAIYLAATAALVVRWVQAAEREAQRHEQPREGSTALPDGELFRGLLDGR